MRHNVEADQKLQMLPYAVIDRRLSTDALFILEAELCQAARRKRKSGPFSLEISCIPCALESYFGCLEVLLPPLWLHQQVLGSMKNPAWQQIRRILCFC